MKSNNPVVQKLIDASESLAETEDLRANCGECLMAHVDVVLLNLDGTCSCCATGHKLAEVRK